MPFTKSLPGYPTYEGSKKRYVLDIAGPGAAANGAETLSAAQLGEGGFDYIEPCNKQAVSITQGGTATTQFVALSISGTYIVTFSLPTTCGGDAARTVAVQWYVASTGAAVGGGATDLSAERVRVLAIMV